MALGMESQMVVAISMAMASVDKVIEVSVAPELVEELFGASVARASVAEYLSCVEELWPEVLLAPELAEKLFVIWLDRALSYAEEL